MVNNDMTFPAEIETTFLGAGKKVSSWARKGTHLEHQTYLHLVSRVSEHEISFEIVENQNFDQSFVLWSDRYYRCQMSLSHIYCITLYHIWWFMLSER